MQGQSRGIVSKECPQLVVALDNMPPSEALHLTRELSRAGVRWFKVGLELYSQTGPAFIQTLKNQQLSVFVDLKLHDIPNTVAKAVRAIAGVGADLLTVHCSGGTAMLQAAQKEAENTSLKLLGVTVLTSLASEDLAAVSAAWGGDNATGLVREEIAFRLARIAASAGLSGIVCSVNDLEKGRMKSLSWVYKQKLFITPGIRDLNAPRNDQSSVATAKQAVLAGATHLVVGRPVTTPDAGRPVDAATRFLMEIKEAHGV